MPNGAAGGSAMARALLEGPRWPLASLASATRADEPGSGECPARALLEWPRWPLAFARQRDACLVGAAEGEGLHEAVARLDHVGRAFDALLRQQRRLQALPRGVAGMQPLDIAAAIDEGEQHRGARRGKPERVRERVG